MHDTLPTNDLERAQHEIDSLREELRKAESEIRNTRDHARQKLQEFAREFRVPLTTVLGFSDILSASDKSHSADWNQIAIAGHQLMELITSLEGTIPEMSSGCSHVEPKEPLAPVMHTILHIEDNETNFRLTERILEGRSNLELLWAPNGEQGMEMAAKHAPSLILLDLNLPDIHGSGVLAQLQDQPLTARIPVIVLSADASPTRIERMLQAGARDYLIKPFDIKRFECLIDEALHPVAA